jgi:hypothetical protein
MAAPTGIDKCSERENVDENTLDAQLLAATC